jgi:hypothetical protein
VLVAQWPGKINERYGKIKMFSGSTKLSFARHRNILQKFPNPRAGFIKFYEILG